MRYVLAAVALVVGVAAFVYGGADDSPGLQLLGALIVVAGCVLAVRRARRRI